jgi:hypothetical protein
MLNKIAIAFLAIGLTVTSAHADWNRRYENHNHYYNRGGNDNWTAPLIGGLIIGGMLGAMSEQQQYQQQYYNQYEPICRDVVIGYDLWNRPVFRRICQ